MPMSGVNPQSSLTCSSPVMSLRVIHQGFELFCELMQDELRGVGGRLWVMPWTKRRPFAMKFRFEKICVSALKQEMSNKPLQRVECPTYGLPRDLKRIRISVAL